MKKWITAGFLLLVFSKCFSQKTIDSMAKKSLIILPASSKEDVPMMMSITGDGGWIGFDKRLSNQFVQENAPMIILRSSRYFNKKKTPEQTVRVVEELLTQYMKQWHNNSFILEGYSFGADVMPFVINRLPDSLMQYCKGVALFSPGTSTDFKTHIIQMIGIRHKWKYNVVDEIKKMKPIKTLFFFGTKEHRFPVNVISRNDWQLIYLKGGHSYKKEKANVAKIVFARLDIK